MINSQNPDDEEQLQTILLSSSSSGSASNYQNALASSYGPVNADDLTGSYSNYQTTLTSDGPVNADALTGSLSNYKGTLASASAFDHPLAATSDSDLFSPPPPPDVQNPENLEKIEKSEVSEKIIKSDYLRICVSDPRKEVETNDSYVTYLISTETDYEEYKGREFRVRRRFRDVVALSERLSEVYRGFFVPSRPDKSVVEGQVMQKQEFVEQRRVAVERYLRRLGKHPVIGRGEELRVFLVSEGRLEFRSSEIVKKLIRGESMMRGDSVETGKRGGDWMRLFREVKHRVTVDWGGGKVVMEEEDEGFLEKKERLNQLEKQISNASKQAESLVKAQQKMGETFGELGLAFFKLTKFENEKATSVSQRKRATASKSIATAAVKSGRIYRGLSAQSVKHLDTLHEYMGLMLAVHHAFSDRSSALLTARTLISELSSLHAKAKKHEIASIKSFGGDKSSPRKVELEEAIRVTEDAKHSALREYERIKENNRGEIERLDRERKVDFMNMLKGFVTNQVAYAEKIETEWAKIAEETEAELRPGQPGPWPTPNFKQL